MSREAIEVLDSAASAAITQIFADANICAQFKGRSEVQCRDLQLVATIHRMIPSFKPVN